MPKNVQILTLGDKLKRFFVYLIILVIVSALAFGAGWFLHRGDTGQVSITGNPSPSQINHADLALSMVNTGHMSGTGKIVWQNSPQDGAGSSEHSFGWNVSTPTFGGDFGARFANSGAFVASGPVSGSIHTVVSDKKSGRQLWAGDSPVDGTVTATSYDGQTVAFSVDFSNMQTYAIDVPQPAPKPIEIGVMAGATTHGDWFAGPYGRYNPKTIEIGKNFDVSPWIGGAALQTNKGAEGVILVGASGRFRLPWEKTAEDDD